MSDLIDRISQYYEELGGHRAGTLSALPLNRLEWYLQTHFQGQEVCSVETGCGASTIVFAQYSVHHTVYCYDDRSEIGSSVNYAQNFPGFRHDRVNWMYGPTQRTIFKEPLTQLVDIVLIDGPHGYPFPELEYFAFYTWLKPGGILIVDDIHIPTINNLYRFLLQDDSFRSHGVALTTAYFERTHTPAFNMEGDDWWLQRYNVQSFPSLPMSPPNGGVRLPISVVFDRRLATGAPILTRGFSLLETPPVSEGYVSAVDVRLAASVPERVKIKLDLEPVCVAEREGCGVTVLVNATEVDSWMFDAPGRRTIECEAETNGKDALNLELRNHGLRMASELKGWVKSTWFDARLPNFWLYSVTVSDSSATTTNPTPLRRGDGSIVTFDYDGQPFSFFVDEANDPIQSVHAVGLFSELDVLEKLRGLLPWRARILDVGAHVGNHTVYFDRVMQARRVVPIEPDPRAQFLLRTNCALNHAANVDLSYLDKALGSHNDLFSGQEFDLINIDAAGMELDVLAGLSGTIAQSRPLIFIRLHDQVWHQVTPILEQWHFEVIWEDETAGGSRRLLRKAADEPETTSNVPGPPNSVAGRAALVMNECWAVAQRHGPTAARRWLWRRVARAPWLLRERSVLGALRRLHGLGPYPRRRH